MKLLYSERHLLEFPITILSVNSAPRVRPIQLESVVGFGPAFSGTRLDAAGTIIDLRLRDQAEQQVVVRRIAGQALRDPLDPQLHGMFEADVARQHVRLSGPDEPLLVMQLAPSEWSRHSRQSRPSSKPGPNKTYVSMGPATTLRLHAAAVPVAQYCSALNWSVFLRRRAPNNPAPPRIPLSPLAGPNTIPRGRQKPGPLALGSFV